MTRLERVVADVSAAGPQWREGVRDGLDALRDAMTRGLPQPPRASGSQRPGPYSELCCDAPRLERSLRRLGVEREQLAADLDLLQARSAYGEPVSLGRAVRQLVADVRRHRRHISDVLHEAYIVDIGGEM